MKRTLIGAAVVAASSLAGLSAHAGCADPRTANQQSVSPAVTPLVLQTLSGAGGPDGRWAAAGIVGTWHVSYTVEGSPFAEAFIQWHSDGTEWESINLSVLDGNICLGSWEPLDARRVSRNHIGWLYMNGVLSGYFTETETDVLGLDGLSYSGTNVQKIFDTAGTLQMQVTGTSKATRIMP
jgi:hypothetical protein